MNKLKHEAYAAMDRALQMMSGALEVIAAENSKFDLTPMPAPAHTRRDFTGDDFVIEDLRESLSPAAKRFLCHHLKNTINSVNLYIEAGEYKAAQSVVWQLDDVIEQIMERAGNAHECDEHPAVCECLYHENLRAAEASHEAGGRDVMEVDHGTGDGVEAKKFAGVSEGSAGSVGR